jgi:uncharacterized membrane protein
MNPDQRAAAERSMESFIGYLLLTGVALSALLIVAGLAWRFATTGRLSADYSLAATNLAELVATEIKLVLAGQWRPRLLINLGILALMLTPFARVLASVAFFAFEERSLKYTLITALVLAVLSYGLFLR